ncbi:MAG: glycosyltransferase [Thermodesulfobacteriota bacterium]
MVSVIIPTYNQAKFLGYAIDSVFSQTHKNFELIIVDNHSEDQTEELVSSYKDPRIRYFIFKNHGIIAASRNLGIDNSTGEYVAFLDSDDLWKHDKIEKQLDVFKKNPEAGIVYSDYEIIGENGEPVSRRYTPIHYEGNITRKLLHYNFAALSSVIIKRSCLEDTGKFNEHKELVTCEDWELLLRLSLKYKFYWTHSRDLFYRIHQGSKSNSQERVAAILAALDSFYSLSNLPETIHQIKNSVYSNAFKLAAMHCFHLHDYAKVRKLTYKVFTNDLKQTDTTLLRNYVLSFLGSRLLHTITKIYYKIRNM